jgi:pantoate--beta-alanine ligase
VRTGGRVEARLADGRAALAGLGFAVDYLAVVEPESLRAIAFVEGPARLIAAARLGSVRLLDNVMV